MRTGARAAFAASRSAVVSATLSRRYSGSASAASMASPRARPRWRQARQRRGAVVRRRQLQRRRARQARRRTRPSAVPATQARRRRAASSVAAPPAATAPVPARCAHARRRGGRPRHRPRPCAHPSRPRHRVGAGCARDASSATDPRLSIGQHRQRGAEGQALGHRAGRAQPGERARAAAEGDRVEVVQARGPAACRAVARISGSRRCEASGAAGLVGEPYCRSPSTTAHGQVARWRCPAPAVRGEHASLGESAAVRHASQCTTPPACDHRRRCDAPVALADRRPRSALLSAPPCAGRRDARALPPDGRCGAARAKACRRRALSVLVQEAGSARAAAGTDAPTSRSIRRR